MSLEKQKKRKKHLDLGMESLGLIIPIIYCCPIDKSVKGE